MLLALSVLVVLAVNLVEVKTDADAIFAGDTLDLNSLDTPIGRELIIALVSPHQDARTEAALEIADMLARDPAVTAVNAGPGAFSEAFLDWVWKRRFRLALPQSDDLTVAGLSRHLAQARDSLTSAEGMIFADLLLRDPTGSFSRLIQRIGETAKEE